MRTEIIELAIGTQVWMSKNLDIGNYRNGDSIPEVKDPEEWENLTTGAWCYYDNDPANGTVYGKLYNWFAVNDPRGLAPKGWHVPSDLEWAILSEYLGGENVAGGKLKEVGTSHWLPPNKRATNNSGFTALPAGARDYYKGRFMEIGCGGAFWSSSFGLHDYSWLWYINNYHSVDNCHDDGYLLRTIDDKASGLSVRCIRDR